MSNITTNSDNNEIDIMKMIQEASESAFKERGTVNVLIAGRTGVGKSTLINEIFQDNLATVGQGEPVTKTTKKITRKNSPIAIWDTRGLEMKDYEETLSELENLIKEKLKETDMKEHIHVAWICIHEDGRRVEQAEKDLCKMLAQHMPVIGVITKARSDEGFQTIVRDLLPEAKQVIRVRALSEKLDEGQTLSAMGLIDLVESTLEVLPEAVADAFVAAQKASIKEKSKRANKIVAGAATAAGVVGVAPIPGSDAVAIVPIQIGMLLQISAVFGLDIKSDFLKPLIFTVLGTTGATVAGKTIVTNLLKLIPGGLIAGGVISATTAATLTTSLGTIYIKTLEYLLEKNHGVLPTSDDVVSRFKEQIKMNKNDTTE